MRVLWLFVATLSLLFWSFGVFDMWATLTSWPPYQEQFGADMFTWIQGFPIWRKAIWGLSIGLGIIGSLMMFARMRLAGPALLLAFLLMAAGFAYDLALQDGVSNYGQEGLIASGVLVGLTALFAWAGFASAGKASQSKKTAVEPTPARAAPATATPAQSATPASVPVPPPPEPAALTPAAPGEAPAHMPEASSTPLEGGGADISPPAAANDDLSTPSVEAAPSSPPASPDDEPPSATEPPDAEAKPPAG